MSAPAIVKNSRRARGWSQKELSERSGVAQSSLSLIESGDRSPTVDTLERILASTGHSLVSIPTRRADAATTAARISDALDSGRKDDALRYFIQLNDNLVPEHDEVRFALSIAEPTPTGVKHWDAALAALVDYRLTEEGLPLPKWVKDPSRSLKKSWTFTAGRYVVPVLTERVPEAFLKRGVRVDYETLVSY